MSDNSVDGRSRIISADFIRSVFSLDDLGIGELQEVAFLGRSNVGKSSLVNSLCNRRSLADVSKMPGRTQAFNFFRIKFRGLDAESVGELDPRALVGGEAQPSDAERAELEERLAFFVDLPGYGFAKVSKVQKQKWPELIERYLLGRPTLSAVVLLVDSRRDPGAEEKWVASLGIGGNLIVVLTKVDKLSRKELTQSEQRIAGELNLVPEQIFTTSTLAKDKHPVSRVRDKIFDLLI